MRFLRAYQRKSEDNSDLLLIVCAYKLALFTLWSDLDRFANSLGTGCPLKSSLIALVKLVDRFLRTMHRCRPHPEPASGLRRYRVPEAGWPGEAGHGAQPHIDDQSYLFSHDARRVEGARPAGLLNGRVGTTLEYY